ncbi:MAG: lipase secretion chaperone [Alcanivoracaceae bacterium]
MRRLLAAIAAVVFVALLFIWLPASDTSDRTATPIEQPSPSRQSITEAILAASRAGDDAPFTTGLENLPASLRDTEVDGGFELDANGNLIITHHIRQLFDYFLSAQGEEPLPKLLQRIRAYIHNTLTGSAAMAAENLLDDYIGYMNEVAMLDAPAQPGLAIDPTAVAAHKEQLYSLRASLFDPAAHEAFFAEEEAYDRYTVERLALLQDDSLSSDERARQLAALQQTLPPALQESLHELNQYQDLRAVTEQWQQQDGNPANLRQIREALVGAEAADRLQQLDSERNQWDRRINTWLSTRASLLSNPSLSDSDRTAQIDALRNNYFTEQEQLRVKSLEKIHDR